MDKMLRSVLLSKGRYASTIKFPGRILGSEIYQQISMKRRNPFVLSFYPLVFYSSLLLGGAVYMNSEENSTTTRCDPSEAVASNVLHFDTSGIEAKKNRPKKPTHRLRRANTRLSPVDNVILGYEYNLRENSSLEKVFKYFCSTVVDGRDMMTPLDMVRSITPGVPPSPNTKPLNIPRLERGDEAMKFSKLEVPDFFIFGNEDNGLISFGRYLVILTLLAIPASDLDVAYKMASGFDFKTKQLQGESLSVHNFDFIMSRNIKARGYGYTTRHSNTSIMRWFFGPNLDQKMTFEQFQKFHNDLRQEVMQLEYYLLSDGPDCEAEPTMSLLAFAKSVAALVPSRYRNQLLKRAYAMKEVPPEVLHESIKRHVFGDYSHYNTKIDPKVTAYLATLDKQQAADIRKINVTLEEYAGWKEVVKMLGEMEEAIKLYSWADGHFSTSNFHRSARALCNVNLTKAQIWVIFKLFDLDEDGELHHDDFVRLFKHHGALVDPTRDAEGLGLGQLLSCICQCGTQWLDGTED